MMSPAPGTPAVPIEARVAVSTMFACAPRLNGIPYACATKRAQTPWYSAVPSMLIVAPRGRTNDEIFSEIPMFSLAQRMLMGSVAELDRVTNAVSIASFAPEKNQSGERPAKIRTSPEYMTIA